MLDGIIKSALKQKPEIIQNTINKVVLLFDRKTTGKKHMQAKIINDVHILFLLYLLANM